MTVLTDDRNAASEPLGRLLSQETNVANLLAYLVELGAPPFLRALGLSADDPGIWQEVSMGRSGRIDAIVHDADNPIALIELKVGAAQHGDQFARYDEWASRHGGLPCHLVSLDAQVAAVPAHWSRHLLPDLLAQWASSSCETARVLATAMERALRDVLAQAGGPLGEAKRTAVAIAFRHLDHRVRQLVQDPGLCGGAERTSGGQPSLVFFVRHPRRESEQEWLCVDLRSEADPRSAWKLRLGVEVDPSPDVADKAAATARAQARAHELAVAIRKPLRTSSFARHLEQSGHEGLAASLDGRRGDGLLTLRAEAALDEWHSAANSMSLRRGARKLQRHPLFNHDKGLRLVSLSHRALPPEDGRRARHTRSESAQLSEPGCRGVVTSGWPAGGPRTQDRRITRQPPAESDPPQRVMEIARDLLGVLASADLQNQGRKRMRTRCVPAAG